MNFRPPSDEIPPAKTSSMELSGEVPVLEHLASPTFPPRNVCHPPRLERMPSECSDLTDTTTVTTTSKSDTVTSDESKSPRRRLHFKGPGDIINMAQRRTTSQCSSTEEDSKPSTPQIDPKSPIFDKSFRLDSNAQKSPRLPKRGNVDSTVVGQKGAQYYLAPKDVSVIERISQRAQKRASRIMKPHEVFVELEELRTDPSEELEWEETARWIKFEEDVEEGTGRWGRPHISALTFHSLADLQRGLDKGCVLLDVGGDDFPTIANEIVSSLVLGDMIPQKAADSVLKILLRKHKHRSDATLWDRLKQSALDPDGRLHHISEGIRHRLSLANTQDTDPAASFNPAPAPSEKGAGHPSYLRSHSSPAIQHVYSDPLVQHSRSADDVPPTGTAGDRTSHMPLLGNESPLPPPPPPTSHKKVMFNISPSSHSLDSPLSDTAPTVAMDTTTTTGANSDSTRDAIIDMESLRSGNGMEQRRSPSPIEDIDSKEAEAGAPNGGLGRQTSSGSTPRTLRRNASVASLMSKIPDEAEALTVLVGGVKFLQEPINVFVRLAQSQPPGDLTEVPVPLRFIYLLIGPENGDVNYHEVGRAMATIMSDKHFHEVAYSALNREELLEGIRSFLDDSLVLPPGDWDEDLLLPVMHHRNEERRRRERKLEEAESRKMFAVDPIKHSCKPLGGMIRDVKNLGKRYLSDFRDCLSWQVFISIIFLYIAFIAPAIAFGGLMEEVTLDLIGETETLLATGLCGVVFGLFSVQPLAVLAFTGPLLLFEEIIHENAERFHVDYLPWRAVIGLWVMLILLGLALSEGTFLVTYFTRFSEEIFTGVVAIFFIAEAIRNIVEVFNRNPLCGFHYPCGPPRTNTCISLLNTTNTSFYYSGSGEGGGGGGGGAMDMFDDDPVSCFLTNQSDGALPRGFRICDQPNTAIFSTVICVATFGIAVALRHFRNKKFFGKKGRRIVSDFGMLTALVIMVIVARLLNNSITVETLTVFENYRNSNCTRGWIINPFTVDVGQGFGAIILAILLAMLIFIENQLGLLHVNKPEHKLKKGVGYHLDLAIVGVLTGVCAILGIPFVCVASVRSLQHLQALSVYSNKNAPGEKPRLVYVHEQRVTNIAIHILILLTPLAYKVLAWVPYFVALGVFPYLSYASLKGVQLTSRIKLLFVPPKHHPDVHYVRKVRTLKMHLYTVIQIVLVAILFGIKLSPAGLVYPLAIVLLLPVRFAIKKLLFSSLETEMLDSEEDYPEHHDEGDGEFGEFEGTGLPY